MIVSLLCYSRRGLLKNVLNCYMRFSVQFNNLRKIWRLKKCCSQLIWGVEIHGLLKEQLKIDLYASVSCVEKNPLAIHSSIDLLKSVLKSVLQSLLSFCLNSSKTKPPIVKLYSLVIICTIWCLLSILSLCNPKFV